jgi:hypothetical protein
VTGDPTERVLAGSECHTYATDIVRPANAQSAGCRTTQRGTTDQAGGDGGSPVMAAPGQDRHGEGGHTVLPRSGDVLRVTRAASVQFAEPIMFRVIRVHDWPTYDGWAWLDGYQLDAVGDAVERRSIFVQIDGLQQAQPALLGARAAVG